MPVYEITVYRIFWVLFDLFLCRVHQRHMPKTPSNYATLSATLLLNKLLLSDCTHTLPHISLKENNTEIIGFRKIFITFVKIWRKNGRRSQTAARPRSRES